MLSAKLFKISGPKTPSVIFTDHLFSLLKELNSSSTSEQLIKARTTALLKQFPKQFSNRVMQYDAHEFLKYLCNELDNALTWAIRHDDKIVVPKSEIPFHGEYVLNKVCRNCANPKAPKPEVFEDLCLEIVHGSASAAQQICASGKITMLHIFGLSLSIKYCHEILLSLN